LTKETYNLKKPNNRSHPMSSHLCASLYLRLRFGASLNLQVSFAKEPYKRDYILPKRPIILRGPLIVATPYLRFFVCLFTSLVCLISLSIPLSSNRTKDISFPPFKGFFLSLSSLSPQFLSLLRCYRFFVFLSISLIVCRFISIISLVSLSNLFLSL